MNYYLKVLNQLLKSQQVVSHAPITNLAVPHRVLKSGWHECMEDVLNDNSNIERKDSIFGFYKQVNYQELLAHKVLAMKSLPLINTQLSKHNLGKISTRLRQDLQLLESKNQIKEIFLTQKQLVKFIIAGNFLFILLILKLREVHYLIFVINIPINKYYFNSLIT